MDATRHEATASFLVIAITYYAIAVVVDFVEGMEGFVESFANSLGVRQYTGSHIPKIVEELLEMFGTSMWLLAFVRYLADTACGLAIKVKAEG